MPCTATICIQRKICLLTTLHWKRETSKIDVHDLYNLPSLLTYYRIIWSPRVPAIVMNERKYWMIVGQQKSG